MNWQPISTAPKDGQDILVYCPNGTGVIVVMWDSIDNCWFSGFEDIISIELGLNPSHWLPLVLPEEE